MVTKDMSLHDFLLLVASELNVPAARIEPIENKLRDEWYEDVAALMEITDAQWAGFSLPMRVVDKIKDMLQNTSEPEETYLLLVSKHIETTAPEVHKETLKILQIVLVNILKTNPIDDRVRRLNPTNPRFATNIVGPPYAHRLMEKMGFEFAPTLMYMKNVDFDELNEVLAVVNTYAVSLGLEKKEPPALQKKQSIEFDPFKAGITSTNSEVPRIAEGSNDPLALEEKRQALKKAREEEIAAAKVTRDPKIFRLTGEGNINQVIRKLEEQEAAARFARLGPGQSVEEGKTEEPMDVEPPEHDDQLMMRNLAQVLKQSEENSKFQSKRKKELAKLEKKKCIPNATIRIRFPDKILLQGTFSVKEIVKDLYEFVQGALQTPDRKFTLYISPPIQKLTNPKESLRSMAPATLVNFSWTDLPETLPTDGPFLNESLQDTAVNLS